MVQILNHLESAKMQRKEQLELPEEAMLPWVVILVQVQAMQVLFGPREQLELPEEAMPH